MLFRSAQPHAGAEAALAPLVSGPVATSDGARRLRAPVVARHGLATSVIRALDEIGVEVDDVELHHPSLDDVFFALTGRAAAPDATEAADESNDLVEVPA